MEKSSPEFSLPRGIAFFKGEKFNEISQKDILNKLFRSETLKVSELGNMYLVGSKLEDEYEDDDKSLSSAPDRFILGIAKEVNEQTELFNIGVYFHKLSLDKSFLCSMFLPDGTQLQSEVNPSDDLENEYAASTWDWAFVEKPEEKFHFFAPADSRILHQLQFSFSNK